MSSTKLFVSHSSKDPDTKRHDPAALALLKGICAELRALGHTPLVDQSGDIPAGDDWDREIKHWLFDCHAAIVLFNRAALESWWVQLEAVVLCVRREIDDDFTLFPVLLDDLDPKVFRRGRYKILRVEKSQCVRGKTTAPEIVAEIARKLRQPIVGTPAQRRRAAFAAKLRRRGVDALEEAVAVVPAAIRRSTLERRDARLADDISQWIFDDPLEALSRCEKLVNKMADWVTRQQAESLFTMTQSLWVPEETARVLPETAVLRRRCQREDVTVDGQAPIPECPPPLAMNGRHVPFYTAERCVERAYLYAGELRYTVISTTTRDLDAEAVSAAIRDRIRSWQSMPDPRDDEVDAFIRRDPTTVVVPVPASCAIRPPLTGVSVLDQLMARYPTVLFVLDCGPQLPRAGELPVEPIRLEPAIDLDDETEQYDTYRRIGAITEKLPSG